MGVFEDITKRRLMKTTINTEQAIKAGIIELTDTVWDDIRVPGLSTRLGATSPDLISFGPSGNLLTLGFNGVATMEQVYFAVQMPHSYKLGTDIKPHVHWTPINANAGTVVWQLEYTVAEINGTFGAPTTIEAIDPSDGVAWKHQVKGFASDISGAAIDSVSAMIMCRLFRDPGHGSDDYGSDAGLLEIDFHYEIDTLGSREELSKR